jgi:serine/threonine protein kinase
MIIPLTEVVAKEGGCTIYRGELPPGEYVIGRDPEASIFLDSAHLSRRHAMLTLSYFDWIIDDLGSSNGTRVGGQRITESTAIFPQQDVALGNVQLHLRRLRAEDAKASLAPQTAAVLRYLPENFRCEQRYKIRGVIACGGMGVVLEAEDLATRRIVAMKTLAQMSTAEDVARFIEEGQVSAQLEHPNIVPIYDLNVNELDRPFYTMRLVRGVALQTVLQRLRLERKAEQERYRLSALLAILQKAADAIAYAHAKGVVHRDLKPDNIMLGEFGEVLVMDWGLAKPLGHSAEPVVFENAQRTMVSSSRREDQAALGTLEGTRLGTPQFMSPEQASGQSCRVDGRADIYSLGAILYALVTLQPPVDGLDASEVIEKVTTGRITPPAEACKNSPVPHLPDGAVPPELSRLAMKAMALAPADRHATVQGFQRELAAAQDGSSRSRRFGIFKRKQ